jgi:signal transduction histidine kinase
MKKSKVFLLFILILLLSMAKQVSAKDTCLARILKMPLDTHKVMSMVNAGWELASDYPKSAIRYAELAEQDAERMDWPLGEAEALLLNARCLDYLGEINKGLDLNFKAKELSIKNHLDICLARSLRQIGGLYQDLGKYKISLEYLEMSLKKSQEINYQKGIASAYNDIGMYYWKIVLLKKALVYFYKSVAIKIRIKDLRNLANTYNQIGNIYVILGKTKISIEFHNKSLNLYQRIQSDRGLHYNYLTLGRIYNLQKDYQKALHYSFKSLNFKIKVKDFMEIGLDYSTIGDNYLALKQYDLALDYYYKSYENWQKYRNPDLTSYLINNIASAYLAQKKLDLALKFFNKSLIILTKNNLEALQITNYYSISKIYYLKENYALASKKLAIAFKLIKKYNSSENERDLYELQSQILEKQNKSKEALVAYKKFILLRDSIVNNNSKIALGIQEAKFEFDKKSLADSLKNKEIQKAKDLKLKLQEAELQKQNFKQTALLSGIAILLLVGWLLYSRYNAVNQQRISERKLLLLEKDQALLDERTRIADEMHDDVGADLSNLLLNIRMKERNQNSLNADEIGGLKNSANTIIHKIDEIIWSLNAKRDTLADLLNFIQKYFETLLKDNHLKGEYYCSDETPNFPLSAQLRRNIFLTVKESLNNTLKHAQANKVDIHVTLQENKLQIQIADNGNGFELESIREGNGIKSMKKRAEDSNGKIQIQSNKDSGTTTFLEFELS